MKKYTRFVIYCLPFFTLVGLIGLFWRGLGIDPHRLPSTRIGHPAPDFDLLDLSNAQRRFTQRDFMGQVSLLNVWATWCSTCQLEHAVLMELARSKRVVIYGLNYRDQWAAARRWLQQGGNPYQAVGFDETGRVGIDWGVYGTPETFVIDKQGIVRYRHVGPLTIEQWQNTILPLVEQLE